MPTLAQQRLAKIQRWFARSSAPMQTPLGKMLARGAYASFVPQRMDAPLAGTWGPNTLPIAVPIELAEGVHLAPLQLADPVGQDAMPDRLDHIMNLATDGRELPPAIWIGLQDAAQTLAEARSAAGVGDGLDASHPTLYVPLYRLPSGPRQRLAPLFPFVSTRPDPPECEIAAAARIPAKREPFRLNWY